MEYNRGMEPLSPDDDTPGPFAGLSPEDDARVTKIYNLLAGGITDPQLQALLIYRHLLHTGWLPPTEAERLTELKDDALTDLQLLREELGGPEDKETLF